MGKLLGTTVCQTSKPQTLVRQRCESSLLYPRHAARKWINFLLIRTSNEFIWLYGYMVLFYMVLYGNLAKREGYLPLMQPLTLAVTRDGVTFVLLYCVRCMCSQRLCQWLCQSLCQ